MFEIIKYTPEYRQQWDAYVAKARNATFLFYRNYMDYHSDRFKDYSLLFFKKGKLHSILPAHQVGKTLCSHFGLTYGGLIMNIHVTISDVCQLFEELNVYLRFRVSRRYSIVLFPGSIISILQKKISMPSLEMQGSSFAPQYRHYHLHAAEIALAQRPPAPSEEGSSEWSDRSERCMSVGVLGGIE